MVDSLTNNEGTLPALQFGFANKTKFDSFVEYLKTRSNEFQPVYKGKETTIWDRKAPNFKYQSYVPNPPKRSTIFSQKPWLYGTYPNHPLPPIRRIRSNKEHPILRPKPPKSPQFIRRFRIMRPYTANLQFVKEGKLPHEVPYQNVKEPDFRNLENPELRGMPQFITSEDKDAADIKLKKKFMQTIHGLSLAPPQRNFGKPMNTQLKLKPKWEANLILERDMWPRGSLHRHSAEFTRHKKKIRTAHSAFMERIEDSLTKQWDNEKRGLPPVPVHRVPTPPSEYFQQ